MAMAVPETVVRVFSDDIFWAFLQGHMSFMDALQCLMISGTVPANEMRAVTQQLYLLFAGFTQQMFQAMAIQVAAVPGGTAAQQQPPPGLPPPSYANEPNTCVQVPPPLSDLPPPA